jgi:hypothetical protein
MLHSSRFLLSALLILILTLIATGGRFAFRQATADEIAKTEKDEGFTPIFDGKSLEGWEGDKDLWKVEGGAIVGDSKGIKHNEFLSTKREYGDFELRLEFRLKDGIGNSGIQFRSARVPGNTEVSGYQADIGEKYWGCLYDESRRNKVLVQAPEELSKVLKPDGWNTYIIRAEGDHVTLSINGLKTVDYREPETEIARKGVIALQVHSGPAIKVEFRNLRIHELKPSPKRLGGD